MFKVGDEVWIWYFGVAHKAEVIKVGRKRVRVRFKNCRGDTIEAWRPIDRVKRITRG